VVIRNSVYFGCEDGKLYSLSTVNGHVRWATQLGGAVKTYTLQTEALLPWFERQTPSPALNGAYSFPDQASLTAAAPLTCVK